MIPRQPHRKRAGRRRKNPADKSSGHAEVTQDTKRQQPDRTLGYRMAGTPVVMREGRATRTEEADSAE